MTKHLFLSLKFEVSAIGLLSDLAQLFFFFFNIKCWVIVGWEIKGFLGKHTWLSGRHKMWFQLLMSFQKPLCHFPLVPKIQYIQLVQLKPPSSNWDIFSPLLILKRMPRPSNLLPPNSILLKDLLPIYCYLPMAASTILASGSKHPFLNPPPWRPIGVLIGPYTLAGVSKHFLWRSSLFLASCYGICLKHASLPL